jgi:hypothetical protein
MNELQRRRNQFGFLRFLSRECSMNEKGEMHPQREMCNRNSIQHPFVVRRIHRNLSPTRTSLPSRILSMNKEIYVQ